jgi:hypothetical protein
MFGKLTNVHEIWYERYSTGGHTNLAQNEMAVAGTCEGGDKCHFLIWVLKFYVVITYTVSLKSMPILLV